MRIAVIGVGNMGSWLARELSKNHEIAIYDEDKEKREAVEGVTHLDAIAEVKSFDPEMVINAVSLQHTVEVFEEVAPYLPSACILVDIASIKGKLPLYYQECGNRYASIHPMFGPRFTTFDDLKEENVIIIEESDTAAKQFFKRFFLTRGVHIYECSFDEHDSLMADSLALPFICSLIFAACLPEKAVPGTTFTRHQEVARKLLEEDNHLLAEILFAPYSLAEIEKITTQLENFRDIVTKKSYSEMVTFIETLRKNL